MTKTHSSFSPSLTELILWLSFQFQFEGERLTWSLVEDLEERAKL